MKRAAKYEVYRDRSHGYRWRLVAGNGQIIADSAEAYSRGADARRAAKEARRAARTTVIESLHLPAKKKLAAKKRHGDKHYARRYPNLRIA